MAKKGKSVKGEKKSKASKSKSPNKGQSQKKQQARPKRIFIYALGAGVLAGSIYLAREYWKKRKAQTANSEVSESDTIIINNNLPVRQAGLPASYTSVSSRTSSGSDSFPLKRGSRGLRVKQLQQALAGILGETVMKANGGIDGIFGSGTANALKLAAYPDVIDETTFNKIVGKSTTTVQVVFNPKELADNLYKFSQGKNLEGVLSILNQFNSTSDYASVNEYYKKIGFISKTIVTDLLEYAFKYNEAARQQVKNEFMRIGLKMDAAGKWSLSGFRLFKDLVTLRGTVVTDSRNNRIPVQKNTVLGDEIKVSNGMTWFRSVDKSILQVPTQDVTYT